jgi:hypothetical protein
LLAEADTMAQKRDSGFDPVQTSGVQCNRLPGCSWEISQRSSLLPSRDAPSFFGQMTPGPRRVSANSTLTNIKNKPF